MAAYESDDFLPSWVPLPSLGDDATAALKEKLARLAADDFAKQAGKAHSLLLLEAPAPAPAPAPAAAFAAKELSAGGVEAKQESLPAKKRKRDDEHAGASGPKRCWRFGCVLSLAVCVCAHRCRCGCRGPC